MVLQPQPFPRPSFIPSKSAIVPRMRTLDRVRHRASWHSCQRYDSRLGRPNMDLSEMMSPGPSEHAINYTTTTLVESPPETTSDFQQYLQMKKSKLFEQNKTGSPKNADRGWMEHGDMKALLVHSPRSSSSDSSSPAIGLTAGKTSEKRVWKSQSISEHGMHGQTTLSTELSSRNDLGRMSGGIVLMRPRAQHTCILYEI